MEPDIIPMLTYENGVAAIEWLCRVFGFEEKMKWLFPESEKRLVSVRRELDGQRNLSL